MARNIKNSDKKQISTNADICDFKNLNIPVYFSQPHKMIHIFFRVYPAFYL